MQTYDAALPTDKDWVRLLVGDRDMSAPKLQDEEIDALVLENKNKYLAAAAAAELILARTHGMVEKQVGDLKIKYSDDVKSAYRDYIKHLREKGAQLLLTPTARRTSTFRVVRQ